MGGMRAWFFCYSLFAYRAEGKLYMAMIEIDAEHLQKLIERLFGMVKHLDCELLGHRMFLEALYAHGLDQTEALLTIQTAVDNPSTKAAIDSKYREMEEKIAEQLANAVK
jgi:hypothetical protein